MNEKYEQSFTAAPLSGTWTVESKRVYKTDDGFYHESPTTACNHQKKRAIMTLLERHLAKTKNDASGNITCTIVGGLTPDQITMTSEWVLRHGNAIKQILAWEVLE